MDAKFQLMQPISLVVEGYGEEDRFASQVLDVEPGASLLISPPLRRGDEVPVEPGTRVGVEVAQPDGMYRYISSVRGRRTEKPPALRLEWPNDVKRIQRRNDVRVDVMLTGSLRPKHRDGSLAKPLSGFTSDVSAGGVRFNVTSSIPPQTGVEVKLNLPDETLLCEGYVVRWGENEEMETKYWIAVSFTGIDAAARRELTKFVFDVQRQQRRQQLF